MITGIYPVILLGLRKLCSFEIIKKIILVCTVLGFAINIAMSIYIPDVAYYSLQSRAWEMMFGGLAFLYPINVIGKKQKLVELIGFLLIILAYLYVTSSDIWPGYLSLFPVFGAYLIILSNNKNSLITNNWPFQYIGKASYSIYLWHWPIVVFSFFFDFDINWMHGLAISILFGSISYYFIEKIRFKTFSQWKDIQYVVPVYLSMFVIVMSGAIYALDGVKSRYPDDFNKLASMAESSPYRKSCHVSSYRSPSESCEYDYKNTTWAVLGDSHTVEIAYALAERLKNNHEGVKHFSFSDCVPSYGQDTDFSRCSEWFNDSVNYIVSDKNIENVVIEFRYSKGLFGDNVGSYPEIPMSGDKSRNAEILKSLDETIYLLAQNKKHVYVYYPVPELNKEVLNLVAQEYYRNGQYNKVQGPSLLYYKERNKFIIKHFEQTKYPDNVIFIKPENVFCRQDKCYAALDSKPLYFDDNHPSIYGASLLVKELPID
ncbi:acyltransferase family protein [Vibrio scophthalmi]|uniref:acyltransferase family protein n=1 Tax=Vibrio scophthalmi TaxID=45658 RepID=UPI003872BC57